VSLNLDGWNELKANVDQKSCEVKEIIDIQSQHSNEKLVMILSNEKRKMLGEHKSPARGMDGSQFLPSSFAGSPINAKRERSGQ
jgi:hypothetical protein